MVWVVIAAMIVVPIVFLVLFLKDAERLLNSELQSMRSETRKPKEDCRVKALREFAEWGDRKYLSDHVYQVTWWEGKRYRETNGLPRNVTSKGELVVVDVDSPDFCAVSIPLHEIILITKKGN